MKYLSITAILLLLTVFSCKKDDGCRICEQEITVDRVTGYHGTDYKDYEHISTDTIDVEVCSDLDIIYGNKETRDNTNIASPLKYIRAVYKLDCYGKYKRK